uniref:Uncharacterized protein n=1 Tax=Syphacia muris TaxID=451379 RepID=A0A0N5AQJ9_9BILA
MNYLPADTLKQYVAADTRGALEFIGSGKVPEAKGQWLCINGGENCSNDNAIDNSNGFVVERGKNEEKEEEEEEEERKIELKLAENEAKQNLMYTRG